jgi:hypothetical protein
MVPAAAPKLALKRIATLCVVLFSLTIGGAAAALPVTSVYGTDATGELTGFRTVGGGLDGYGEWSSDFRIDWEITFNVDRWHYKYTLTDLDPRQDFKEISHFTIDVTDDCIGDEGCAFFWEPSGVVQQGDFDGITGAIKFDFSSNTYEFDSQRNPVYGHVAVKDGGGSDTCADANPTSNVVCNVGLGLAAGDQGTMDIMNYIARPNGEHVPEPTTGLVMALGLLAATRVGRRERSRR